MRRKSEKGFMLLETLVVTVFIATLFAFIYQNTIPLFGEYKQRMKYDDVDSVYAADLFRQMLLADYNYNDLASGLGNDPTNIYKDITDCRKNVAGFNYENDDLCEALEESLNISAVYLTHYDTNLLKQMEKDDQIFTVNTDRGIKTYIDYMPSYSADSTTINQYRLIIVRKVVENGKEYTRYANLEVVQS